MAVALVVAAGSGERLGADRPKAFVLLAGRPMVEWSLDALRAAGIEEIVVAVPPELDEALRAPLRAAGCTVVVGGAVRSHSVRRALAAASAGRELVLVHDAARPLAPPDLFIRCVAALAGADAAIAAAPVTDTIKEAGQDGVVARTLDRSGLWSVQTPQAFRRDVLQRALDVPAETLAAATDDAWLVEQAGGRVLIVESSAANLKVTTPIDLEVAARALAG